MKLVITENKMKKILILFLFFTFITGCCYNKQKVILEEPDFKPGARVLVYEDEGGVAGKYLRGALRKRNIKILKYASNDVFNINKKTFTKNGIKEEDLNAQGYRQYDGTPYVVSLDYSRIFDRFCPTSDVNYYDVSVEITNLDNKNVVFSADVSGGDEPCCYCRSNLVFENLADLIADFWNRQEK